jgi:ferrochelatase
VIENQGLVWKFVLNAIILPRRPRAKAATTRKSGIASETSRRCQDHHPSRRPGAASAATVVPDRIPTIVVTGRCWLLAIQSIGARESKRWKSRLRAHLLLPLYRNMPRRTTGHVLRRGLCHAPAAMRDQPGASRGAPYYAVPVYIEALADPIEDSAEAVAVQARVILASVPRHPEIIRRRRRPLSEPLRRDGPAHAASGMKLDEAKLMLSFQSRFGRAEWLQPYTDKTVEALAQRGVKNLAVVTPGFSADCLETLEEIAVENGDIFKANGGENFAAIPCLNDSAGGMTVISQLVLRELQGWI